MDIFEYPTKDYTRTIREELIKFTQAYPLKVKIASSVVDILQEFSSIIELHFALLQSKTYENCKLCRFNHPQSYGSIEGIHATHAEMTRVTITERPNQPQHNTYE